MLRAPATTWRFVTIYPDGSITNPDPSDCPPLWDEPPAIRSRNSPSRPAVGVRGRTELAPAAGACVVEILTTVGDNRLTSALNPSGAGRAAALAHANAMAAKPDIADRRTPNGPTSRITLDANATDVMRGWLSVYYCSCPGFCRKYRKNGLSGDITIVVLLPDIDVS